MCDGVPPVGVVGVPACVGVLPFCLCGGRVEGRVVCVFCCVGLCSVFCVLSSVLPPFCLCVCCHSIVGLVLCFSVRVVLLWDSGDGLCVVEGRVGVVFTVRC